MSTKFASIKNRKSLETFKRVRIKSGCHQWDGKLLLVTTTKNIVKRLPIIITSENTEQIPEIPKLQTTIGKDLVITIYETLKDWGLTEIIKAICCDTMSINLSYKNGASILLKEMLQRKLLHFLTDITFTKLLLRVFSK